MSIPILAVLVAIFTIASTSLLHDKRIVNGKVAKPMSHPYMVSLQQRNENNIWEHNCGGVLIDENWVLTAAHCVVGKKESSLKLILGEQDLESSRKISRDVYTYITHENYVFSNNDSLYDHNDIALIRMEDPVEIGGNIQVVKLSQDDSDFVGLNCVIAGWGWTGRCKNTTSKVLREVSVNYITNKRCAELTKEGQKENGKDGVFDDILNNEHMLCAFDFVPKSQWRGCAFRGDSGGPMMCGKDHRILVGLVSAGYFCHLSFMTRVSKYITWIIDTKHAVDSKWTEL